MSKIYNPKKSEYSVPASVYYRTIYLIKDYPRLKLEADGMLESTPPPTETPEIQRQRNLRAEETKALKYAVIMADIRDIEEALMSAVPPDARTAILASIIDGKSYPIDKTKRTYSRYKQKFIHDLAEKRGYL